MRLPDLLERHFSFISALFKKTVFFIIIFFSFFSKAKAVELGGLNTTAQKSGADKITDIDFFAGSLVTQALSLVGILFLVLMLYNGIVWMTAAGNEERVKKALTGIRAAIIGLIVVISAYAITVFIGSSVN